MAFPTNVSEGRQIFVVPEAVSRVPQRYTFPRALEISGKIMTGSKPAAPEAPQSFAPSSDAKTANKGAPRRPWLSLPPPALRPLKVYALDPSAGNYVGNLMTIEVKWERLLPGPVGGKVAVVDYDPVNKTYYPPVNLDDPHILMRGGLDPTESDPRFHQQMVYAVASETIQKFEAALGRQLHWHRADRVTVGDAPLPPPSGQAETSWRKADDIWVLNLYPHAMVQENAFYSREAKGILFGYFKAETSNQGRNLPGQRVFTCLSHDIIAHETTHAIIDGIRAYFTESTNPDVLAFHEGFADLSALFQHFTHRGALLDTLQRTGGRLFDLEIRAAAALPGDADSSVVGRKSGHPTIAAGQPPDPASAAIRRGARRRPRTAFGPGHAPQFERLQNTGQRSSFPRLHPSRGRVRRLFHRVCAAHRRAVPRVSRRWR
jgi:hypothetical protein